MKRSELMFGKSILKMTKMGADFLPAELEFAMFLGWLTPVLENGDIDVEAIQACYWAERFDKTRPFAQKTAFSNKMRKTLFLRKDVRNLREKWVFIDRQKFLSILSGESNRLASPTPPTSSASPAHQQDPQT